MQMLNASVTDKANFYQGLNPYDLIETYGSPLYVYNERILKEKCNQLKNLSTYKNFSVHFSAKANSNLALLQIIRGQGLCVDAMSPGEIYIEQKAGFTNDQIFFVCNNISAEEMQYAIDRDILLCVDSTAQLEQYGSLNPGGAVSIRINPGVGAGHHEKVVTAGKNTKFGILPEQIPSCKEILAKHQLRLVGINQHIGSLFMEPEAYLAGVNVLFDIARHFDNLEFIDCGGGFGINYQKQTTDNTLDLAALGDELTKMFEQFAATYNPKIKFKIEPGRFPVAECGVLLGTVHAVKYNADKKYIGTDIGFNALVRPVMYDAHHDIEVYRKGDQRSEKTEAVTVVGNICESGDILAKDRMLPEIFEGDMVGVLDAGAYGHVMSSNYNNRLRPAEVLIRENGECVLIRKRDTIEQLAENFISIE